jgi:hypothetical protein
MQSVEMNGLRDLDGDFEHILRELPGARRRLHEEVGAAILAEVREHITSTGINDARGRVKGYQEHFVGSGGGYAAVRAVRGRGPHGSSDSPGAITNYLENGHKIRRSSGTAKRRRKGRAKKPYVDGYGFYEAARANAETVALAAAERYADSVADMLDR